MPYGSSFIRSCLSTSGPFLPWIIDWGTTDLGTIWSGFYCHFMDIIFLNLSHIIIKSAPLLLPAHSLLSSHPLRLTASVLRSLRSLRPKASRSGLKGEERESWAEVTRGMKSEPSLTDATPGSLRSPFLRSLPAAFAPRRNRPAASPFGRLAPSPVPTLATRPPTPFGRDRCAA